MPKRYDTKPFKKATNAQVEIMTEHVAELMVNQMSKFDIHRAMEKRFKLGWRQVDRYMTRAKTLLVKRASITRDQAREGGVNLLLDLIRTGDSNVKLKAERRLGEIFGYNAPAEHRITTPVGMPLQTEDLTPAPKIPKAKLNEILNALMRIPEKATMGGNGNGNGHGEVVRS